MPPKAVTPPLGNDEGTHQIIFGMGIQNPGELPVYRSDFRRCHPEIDCPGSRLCEVDQGPEVPVSGDQNSALSPSGVKNIGI